MSDTKTFNAQEVVIAFVNRAIDSGYASGEFVNIKKTTPDNSSKAGADGEVGISASNDKRATIEIKLLQTSAGHPILGAIRNAGLAAGRPVVGPLEINDLGGALLWSATKAWISKPPDPNFSNEVEEWTWTLEASDGKYNFPGVLPL